VTQASWCARRWARLFDRALQLLQLDPSLGGILCIGFRPELPDKARRLGPQSQLTAKQTPWGIQPGVLDAPGRLTADLDLLQPEAQAALSQRLDAGGLSLVAWSSNPPWVHLADRLAFLLVPGVPRQAYAQGQSMTLNLAISLIAKSAAELAVEGHRADLLALRAAQAIASAAGRRELYQGDLAEAIDLVLAPRARAILPAPIPARSPELAPDQNPGPGPGPGAKPDQADAPEPQQETTPHTPPPGESTPAPPLPSPVPVAPLPSLRHRLRPSLHGAPVRAVPGRQRKGTLNLTATLLAAIPWQRLRGNTGLPLAIRPSDLRWTLRRPRQGRLVIFIVDGSGSVGPRRLGQAKGAVMHLLQQAYRSRDQVALITAAGSEARLLLPPARAVEQARRRLLSLPAGGATPLTGALLLASRLARFATLRDDRPSILLILTDGRATQPHHPLPESSASNRKEALRTELRQAALLLRKQGVPAILFGQPGAEAQALSNWLGGRIQPMRRDLILASSPS